MSALTPQDSASRVFACADQRCQRVHLKPSPGPQMFPSRDLRFQYGGNAWYRVSSGGPATQLRRMDLELPS